jgi:hypothetical protein
MFTKNLIMVKLFKRLVMKIGLTFFLYKQERLGQLYLDCMKISAFLHP